MEKQMKKAFKVLLLGVLLSLPAMSFSQNDTIVSKLTVEPNYERWSLDINLGQNKAITPFTQGYYQSDARTYFPLLDVNSFSIGVRRMFTPKVGFKVTASYNTFSNSGQNNSLPFETKTLRTSFEGVFNLGRAWEFETFTKRVGLLAHLGGHYSSFAPSRQVGLFKRGEGAEDNGGFIMGITPQYKINNWLVINSDFTYVLNTRQHYTWDGNPNNYSVTNLTGSMVEFTFGLTFYIYTSKPHADWYVANK
jgi:OOP family OmpA-OmpF porin